MQELIINKNEAGQRFDKYLQKYLKEAPKSFIYKMIRKKNIELNSKKATGNEMLKLGDSVKLFMSDETIAKFRGTATDNEKPTKNIDTSIINNRIIYEDEDILIVDKPAGILSQKASPTDISLNEILIAYISEECLNNQSQTTFKPSVCNRLDRNTTGLITFGKTLRGAQELSAGFKERTFDKYYLAVVWGEIKEASLIDGYLTKNSKTLKVSINDKETMDSSYIKTYYEPLDISYVQIDDKKYPITLLKIKLLTGKTHQIRAHLSSINHSLLGDDKYGILQRNKWLKQNYNVNFQLLHSYELMINSTDKDSILYKLNNTTIKANPDKIYKKFFPDFNENEV